MFFNPDPYVKFQVLPHNQRDKSQKHHYQEHRSSVITGSANPVWITEVKYEMIRKSDTPIPPSWPVGVVKLWHKQLNYIKGKSNFSCSYAQWYCKWASAAV